MAGENEMTGEGKARRLSTFEKYLTLRVALCIVAGILLGSTTEDVLRNVNGPVLLVRLRIIEIGDEATCRLAALKRQFEEAGFVNVGTVLRTGNAIDEVLSLAKERGATLIVLGAKGRHGIIEQIFGGVAEAVVHRSESHVLVVR